MKKVIALTLALVLALSLGVSAFATLTPVVLKPINTSSSTTGGYTLIKNDFELVEGGVSEDIKETIYVNDPEGGVLYVAFVLAKADGEYKNFTFEKDGVVSSVEQIAYDPAKFTTNTSAKDPDGKYTGWAGIDDEKYFVVLKNDKNLTPIAEADASAAIGTGANQVKTWPARTGANWDAAKKAADAYNATTAGGAEKAVVYCDSNIYLFKITVDSNYDVAYKDGYYKISADKFVGNARKGIAYSTDKQTLVSDVAVFDYDRVTYAAENDVTLYVGGGAYSDYRSYLATYMPEYKGLKDEDVFLADGAIVVSTTEFRAIAGKPLTVGYDALTSKTNAKGTYSGKGLVSLVIPEVAAGQKGVNLTLVYGENRSSTNTWGKLTSLEFNFKGADVIASDATVQVDLPYSNLELLNDFGKKVEEEDVVTYYILKDGKSIGSFVVDYLTADWNTQVKFDIPVKAGEALGKYTVALSAPTSAAEENPNTGAESVVGVVAAMAVVSVVAVAVSLKK